MNHTELQYRRRRKSFFNVLCDYSRTYDSDLFVLIYYLIYIERIGVRFKTVHPRLDGKVPPYGVSRHHRKLGGILNVWLQLVVCSLLERYERLGVRYSRRSSQHYRRIVLFRKFVRELYIFLTLGAVARFEHRSIRRYSVISRVLFVLRRVHTGIVRNYQNESGVYPRICVCKKRIRGYVHTDVLHTNERSRSRDRRAYSDLRRYFLVRRPFDVNVFIIGDRFRYLRARSTGIRGGNPDSRFVSSSCYRFVAKHYFLIHNRLLKCFLNRSLSSPCLRIS